MMENYNTTTMAKSLIPVAIPNNMTAAKFVNDETLIKALPKQNEHVLWQFSGDDLPEFAGAWTVLDDKFVVMNELENIPYPLSHFSHWYKQVD